MSRVASRCVRVDAWKWNWLKWKRQLASCLVVVLTFPCGEIVAAQQSNSTAGQSLPAEPTPPTSYDPQLESSSLASSPFDARKISMASQASIPDGQSGGEGNAQDQKPLGTAAAPYDRPTGVAGSRPAGAAIAPGKQKRVRSIVIKVGVIVAAGAATGAVVGLSRASHGQPQ